MVVAVKLLPKPAWPRQIQRFAPPFACVRRTGYGQFQLAIGDPGRPAGAGAARQCCGCRRCYGRDACLLAFAEPMMSGLGGDTMVLM